MSHLMCTVGEYGVIVNSQGEILTLELPQNQKYKEEKWMLSGGRLEDGEKPVLGLKREILEETGLEVKVVCPVYTAVWGYGEHQKYSVFYLCHLEVESGKVVLGNEHQSHRWVKFEEADVMPWHNENSLMAVGKAAALFRLGLK